MCEKNVCVKCGLERGPKRWKFHFGYNKACYVCAPCIEFLGGAMKAQAWLERGTKVVVSE